MVLIPKGENLSPNGRWDTLRWSQGSCEECGWRGDHKAGVEREPHRWVVVPMLLQETGATHARTLTGVRRGLGAQLASTLPRPQSPAVVCSNSHSNKNSQRPPPLLHPLEESDSCSSSGSSHSTSSILRVGGGSQVSPPVSPFPHSTGGFSTRSVRFVEPDHSQVDTENANLERFAENQKQHRLNARLIKAAPVIRGVLGGVCVLGVSSFWVLVQTWSDASGDAIVLRRMLMAFLVLKLMSCPLLLFSRGTWHLFLQCSRENRHAIKNLVSTGLYLWCACFSLVTGWKFARPLMTPSASSAEVGGETAIHPLLLWYCGALSCLCVSGMVVEALFMSSSPSKCTSARRDCAKSVESMGPRSGTRHSNSARHSFSGRRVQASTSSSPYTTCRRDAKPLLGGSGGHPTLGLSPLHSQAVGLCTAV